MGRLYKYCGITMICAGGFVLGCSASEDGSGEDSGFQGPTNPFAGNGSDMNEAGSGAAGAMAGDPGGPHGRGQAGSSGTGSGGPGPGEECGRIDVRASRVTPRVELVVDASLSMNDPFQEGGNCGTRWQCLQDALVGGDTSIVAELQGLVEFGLNTYTGPLGLFGGGGGGECPSMTRVDPALNNYEAIRNQYMATMPEGSTPTDVALAAVADQLQDANCLDCEIVPQIVILVTDGDPNSCMNIEENRYAETEAQVEAIHAKGAKLYPLTLAGTDQSTTHLQKVANLGVGMPANANPGAEVFRPTNIDQLREQIRSVISGAVTCDLELQAGKVEDPTDGTVVLNSDPLELDGRDGWILVDEQHIALQGAACNEWLNNPTATLSADFPCEDVILE